MKHHNDNPTVIDLRGVRTQAEEARERLRMRLKQEAASRDQRMVDVSVPIATPTDVRPKTSVRTSAARIASLLLLVGVASQVLPGIARSLSYFTDTEGAPVGLAAALLSIEATDPGGPLMLACGASVAASESAIVRVATSSLRSLPFHATVSVASVSGSQALCDALDLFVEYVENGGSATTTLYTGPVSGFTGEVPGAGTLTLRALLDDEAGPFTTADSCALTLSFLARSGSSEDEAGFTDTATTSAAWHVENNETCPGPCEEQCEGGYCGSIDVDVENHNETEVHTTIDFSQNTGGNSANGGNGGNGGSGAPGGDGGSVGVIHTGNSTSVISIETTTNTNIVEIDAGSCGCACGSGCECPNEGTCTDESQPQGSSTSGPLSTEAVEDKVNSILADMQKRLESRFTRNR